MKKKNRIIKGVVTAVLACMLSTAFFSADIEAAESKEEESIETIARGASQITYDPNEQRTGYHLEVLDQKQCNHSEGVQSRNIYTTMTGLTPTAEQVISRIVNEGLNYTVDSYICPPEGIGAERIGNTAVAIHVFNVGNALNERQDAVLSSPYKAVNGYAGYTYYWTGFSHCPYTGKDYYVGGGHTWLGDAVGTVGANEVVNNAYSHIVTRYRFVPNNYTVTYNGNGATEGYVANQTVTYDQIFNLSNNGYKKDGAVFCGWNTAPDGSGQSFSEGQSVSNLTAADGGTVTLYAQWKAINYKVHFDGNGATSGNTPDMSYAFDQGGALNANGFKKQYSINYNGNGGTSEKEADIADAQFNGWQDNNVFYYWGMYFNSYGIDAPYYVNKYPDVKNWCGYNKYAVIHHWYTYIISQGVEDRQSAQNFKIGDYMKYGGGDLKAAFGDNRLAYVAHWMNNGIYEGRTGAVKIDTATSDLYPDRAWVANLATRQNETVVLTADWTPGSVVLPKAERAGYQFAGWYNSPEGGEFIGKEGATYTPEVSGTTLYAHWVANDYEIAFDGNGATSGNMENQKAKYDEVITLQPNQFERTGYTFTGWNTNSDGTGTALENQQQVKNLTTEENGTVILYAQWKANAYIIHFDGNEATDGAMEDISAVYNQDITLPPNQFVRTTEQGESVFTGWNLENGIYDAEFADQQTVRNLSAEDGAVVTLYAIWDDCPEIEAVDRYFSLSFAQQGKITEEELLSTASATDREDGELENRTGAQIAETGINGSLSLYGYATTDFTELTASASVSMTYKAVDSIGNTVYKTVTVYITNTEPIAQTDFAYTRFINEKYYKAAYENGGLHPKSVWRIDPAYESTLQNALANLKNETPEETYYIKKK